MLVVFRKKGYETGKILGGRLKAAFPRNVKVTNNERRAARLCDRFNAVLLRWGISDAPEIDDGTTINPAHALKLSTHKLEALLAMKARGVTCPRVWKRAQDIESFPVLGRDIYHHGGLDVVKIVGSNIRELNDYTKIPKKDFYVEFIPSKLEYRVHVFESEPIRVTKKSFRGQNRDGEEVAVRDTIRNDIYGWGMSNVAKENWPQEVCAEAVKAVDALGLSFGAVDVIVSSVSNIPYVLEVNSAPRLNVVGQELYLQKICESVGFQFNRDLFGFEDEEDDELDGNDTAGEEDDEAL